MGNRRNKLDILNAHRYQRQDRWPPILPPEYGSVRILRRKVATGQPAVVTIGFLLGIVTGASSGLGKAVVIYALSKGDQVVATCRKPSSLDEVVAKHESSQLLVIKLDVTSTKDIAPAFDKAVAKFGRIDVVYINAGYAVLGEAEVVPEDVARSVFEVNFWGATNVSRESVRTFREVNKPQGGVLLQASSVAGAFGLPGLTFYSAR